MTRYERWLMIQDLGDKLLSTVWAISNLAGTAVFTEAWCYLLMSLVDKESEVYEARLHWEAFVTEAPSHPGKLLIADYLKQRDVFTSLLKEEE